MEERCRVNTRPYTEKRCYSRLRRGGLRTIAVIREREGNSGVDRRVLGEETERRRRARWVWERARGEKRGLRARSGKKKKKGVASRRH